jgi:hypothetical protein
MKFHKIGEGQKAGRWTGLDDKKHGDVRCYRAPRGYDADATLTDIDVITGKELTQSRWFIILTKRGF